MFLHSLAQGISTESDDPERQRVSLGSPRLAIQCKPDLVRLLRGQPMKTKRRKQADGSPWHPFSDFGERMILPGLDADSRVETTTNPAKDSLFHKTSKLRPPNSMGF
jgi:hypothetical protein